MSDRLIVSADEAIAGQPTRTMKVPRGSFYYAKNDPGTKVAQCAACSKWTTNFLVMDAGPHVDPLDPTARKCLFICFDDAERYRDWLNAEVDRGVFCGDGLQFYPYLLRWLKEKMHRTL